MVGNVITTLIILIASVVLGAGIIFFGGSLFEKNIPDKPTVILDVKDKVISGGNTRCVIEYNATNYIIADHLCLESIGTPMNVTGPIHFPFGDGEFVFYQTK